MLLPFICGFIFSRHRKLRYLSRCHHFVKGSPVQHLPVQCLTLNRSRHWEHARLCSSCLQPLLSGREHQPLPCCRVGCPCNSQAGMRNRVTGLFRVPALPRLRFLSPDTSFLSRHMLMGEEGFLLCETWLVVWNELRPY